MIVNSTNDCSQMMDSGVQQSENNFFLKRKLTLDMLDSNGSYVQPKKRFIQNFSHNFVDECAENYNLNGNVFNGDCPGIELINFDAVTLVPPIQTTTAVFTTTSANSENFETTWSSADLLELDQRYNTVINLNTEFSSVAKDCSLDKRSEVLNSSREAAAGIVNNPEQNDIDFDDRNLSWLFNFKLDELPHLSPEVNRNSQLSPPTNRQQKQQNDQSIQQQIRTGRKVDELIMETTADLDESDMTVAENVVVDNTPKMPKKPPFTYTELIEYALEDKGELTVSGIYQWISDRFPFYKSNDDRWKNSVRHNLSINPHFRKGVKAAQGAGHLWTISSRDSAEHNLAWQHKKQRLELFFKLEQSNQQRKAAITPPRNNSPSFDETAAAVANLTQQIQDEVNSAEMVQNTCLNSGQPCNTSLTTASMNLVANRDSDLERTAGEILNGVHRDVEVQSVHSTIITYQDSLLEGDYLNSTTDRDHLSADHHLRLSHHHNHHNDIDNAFYVTEIDPVELGINMSNVEEEVLFSDEFNLNYFGITPGSDIVA